MLPRPEAIALPTFNIPDAPHAPMPAELVCRSPVMVAGDWHIPHYHAGTIRLLIAVAKRDGIRSLILNGDFLNEDVFLFGGTGRKPAMPEFLEECTAAGRMLAVLLQHFDTIYWNAGNHEERWFRMNNGQVGMAQLLRLMLDRPEDRARVLVTDRDYVLVEQAASPRWRVTHGQTGGVRSAVAGPKLKAQVYGCNVLQGHTHLWGEEPTSCGRYVGATHGCIADPAAAAYKMMRTTTYSQWQLGFASITNGRLRLYSQQHTDWSKEL